MLSKFRPVETPSTPLTLSASAWSLPYVLMTAWGVIQLWLHESSVQSLSQDLIMALIYSTVIAGSMLPIINRSVGYRISTGKTQHVIEDALGCLLVVLALSVALALVLVTQSQYFRDPLHLAIQLAGVVLMANCWILSVILFSSGKQDAVFNSVLVGCGILALAAIYQPMAGLSYYSLAWLSAIAAMLLLQAKSLTKYLPRPSRISLSLVIGRSASMELSLAGTSLCLALWLSRPSAHSPAEPSIIMRSLEDSQSTAYLLLLPVAMIAWTPLEKRFKEALFAFEHAANGGGNLNTLDYHKNNLVFQALSGMQRVHIALIAAVVVALAIDQLLDQQWSTFQWPSWMLPLSLVHVGLQMVTLCTMRLLFYLQRDRELLALSMLHLLFITLAVGASHQDNVLVISYGLVVGSSLNCVISVWLLRHRLNRLDYLFFMGSPKPIHDTD